LAKNPDNFKFPRDFPPKFDGKTEASKITVRRGGGRVQRKKKRKDNLQKVKLLKIASKMVKMDITVE